MGKGIMFLIFVGIAVLLIGGIYFPQDQAMWMASTAESFTWLRGGLLVLLGSLLITHPPRNVYFRIFVGAFSSALALWVLHDTYTNAMAILDSFALLGAACAMGIVALEYEPEDLYDSLTEQNRLAHESTREPAVM